ncbi:hypothetical protein [Roseococcus sp.]|uniref:hypothetical protein n=1 Tax=Roseococcus sp. TaxID=2109646 RepID=UPI003BAAA01F
MPGYSLTVARGDTDSIRNRVIDAFDPPEWFRRLLASPYSAQWSDAFSSVNGRVLFAVTKPYAEMASQSLAAVPASALSRLRIFGAGLGGVLPAVLKPFLLPYDDRLDTIFPGTRSDFAQRALVHFSRNIAPQDGDISLDAEWVRRAMAKSKSPLRPVRSTATDEALLAVIRSRLHPRASASQLLRRLRDDDQIACEQGRFAKLFRQAQSEGDCS